MTIGTQLNAEQLATLRLLRNGQLLGSLIRIYCAQVPQQLLDIQNALEARDTAIVITIAHTLKSASFTLGATQMGQLSTSLERAAIQCDIVECNNLAMALRESYDALLPDLVREERA